MSELIQRIKNLRGYEEFPIYNWEINEADGLENAGWIEYIWKSDHYGTQHAKLSWNGFMYFEK